MLREGRLLVKEGKVWDWFIKVFYYDRLRRRWFFREEYGSLFLRKKRNNVVIFGIVFFRDR